MDWLNRLKWMKSQSNKTAKEIAILSKVPEPTLEKLFAGQTKDPRLNTIWAVVHCLGYTIDDLFPELDAEKNAPSTLKNEALKVAQAYEVADSDIRRSVRKLLDLDVAAEISNNRFVPRHAAARGDIDLSKENPSDFTFSGSDGTSRIP